MESIKITMVANKIMALLEESDISIGEAHETLATVRTMLSYCKVQGSCVRVIPQMDDKDA